MSYYSKKTLLDNKTILLTGATDGIGFEAAKTYVNHGANVIIIGRNWHKLQHVVNFLNALRAKSAHAYSLDMVKLTPECCQTFGEQLSQELDYLDGVLHSAGILGDITPLAQFNTILWQQVMQINLNAAFYLTQTLLPLLLKSTSASLVFTSSSVGRKGRANWGAYAISKFAIEGMMQVLAEEYQQSHLRVNCINPGATRTKMRAKAFPKEDASILKTPAEIMPLYLCLMSDDSWQENGISFDAQSYVNN